MNTTTQEETETEVEAKEGNGDLIAVIIWMVVMTVIEAVYIWNN